jgi:hypothetical protein
MDREQEQRDRAYKMWEEEGRPTGKHDEHWARAGQESNLPAREADETTEANQAADERFAVDDKGAASAPLLKTNPD